MSLPPLPDVFYGATGEAMVKLRAYEELRAVAKELELRLDKATGRYEDGRSMWAIAAEKNR